jgi:transcriptional regulator with XRE-family HTH domain
MNLSTLPAALALARRHAGLTGAELARRCGFSRQAVYQAESGYKAGVSLPFLAAVAAATGCDFTLTADGRCLCRPAAKNNSRKSVTGG